MKIILFLLLCGEVFAENQIVQHNTEFNISEVSPEQIHYWGKVSSWSKWLGSGRQDLVQIDKNPIYTAYSRDYEKFDVKIPELPNLQQSLGEQIGKDFHEFLKARKLLSEDEIFEHSAIVYQSKLSAVVPHNIDKLKMSMDELSSILQEIDRPHVHNAINTDLAHGILEPLHSGHRRIEEAQDSNQKIIFSTVRLEDYGCDSFMGMIASLAEAQGEDVKRRINENGDEVPVFRLYSLSSLHKLSQSYREDLYDLFGETPDEVYVQEVLYSSKLLKAGTNYWALFKDGANQTRVVNYSVMAFTTKMKVAMGMFLNGVTGGAATSGAIGAASEVASKKLDALRKKLGGSASQTRSVDITDVVVNESWVDLNDDNVFKILGAEIYDKKICSQGLGLGVPRYTLGNFKRFIEKLK